MRKTHIDVVALFEKACVQTEAKITIDPGRGLIVIKPKHQEAEYFDLAASFSKLYRMRIMDNESKKRKTRTVRRGALA